MKPGNKYVLRFHNRLPYQPASTAMNVFKDPNVSNAHTHGLHISGESPSDDVTRSFEGGFGGDFVYDIPANHMGGTYWYHAHHHGSTYLQVSGGAFQAQNCSGSFENGEYYDTLTSACSVRFDLNAATSSVYEGRTILHCHILEHEDQGAMGWLDTVGGLPPPSFPTDSAMSPPFGVHYSLN
jgi:FtsP/CotA-like multicopper oxidase with cupredoxin domain